jgi:2-polyprenyl-3-methyl-5-hydroxy-6-metoxy-1,4-benzoquinol methylase
MQTSNEITRKWDQRYRGEEFVLGTEPSSFLAENIEMIKLLVPGNKAMDLACGEGRNSIFLAREGMDVTGVDISEAGVEKAVKWMEREKLNIDFRIQDLEEYQFSETFDLIINFNFLLRNLIAKSVTALNPGGVMVFDSILDSPFVPTTHKKEFLLKPGELHAIFSAFPGRIFLSEERLHDRNPTARLIFQNTVE